MHLPDDRIVLRLRRTKHQPPPGTNGSDTTGFSAPVVRMIRHRRQSVRVSRPMTPTASRQADLPLVAGS